MHKQHTQKNISLIQQLVMLVVAGIVRGYRMLRPITNNLLYSAFGWSSSCVHSPSCSEYAIRAIRSHGTMRGLFLGLGRVLTCGISPSSRKDSLGSMIKKTHEYTKKDGIAWTCEKDEYEIQYEVKNKI